MPIFTYKALNERGQKVDGLVEADDESSAVEIIRDNNLEILFLGEGRKYDVINWFYSLIPISKKDLMIFSRQFAILISASVPVVQALRILSGQSSNARLRMIIKELSNEVDAGSLLSEVFEKHENVFSPFYINVLRTGETSGRLDEVLVYLADELEKDYDLTRKIRGAMIYPAVIMSVLLVVGAAMMIFVVPKMTQMLIDSGAELPIATRILIAISSFMVSYWWVVLILIISCIFALLQVIKTPGGKRIFDIVMFRLPVFGELLRKVALVRFARSLHVLLKGGVNISVSLKIVGSVVGNTVFRDIIDETRKEVEDGNSIASVFMKSDEIPKMFSEMIAIGEKTSNIDVILERISIFYGKEVDNTVSNLMVLLEPIVLLALAAGVLTILLAIMLPMYSITNSV